MPPRETDRAVSTALSYVLALTITAVLVSGLLTGTGQYVEEQQRQVTEEELSVLGERLAARTADADRMVRAGDGASDVRVRIDLPRTVAGQQYRIEVSEPAVTTPRTYELTLTTTGTDQSWTVRVRTGTAVRTGSVSGGTVVVAYDAADDRLALEADDEVVPALAAPAALPAASTGGVGP